MQKLNINDTFISNIPNRWSDLTPEQMKAICKLSFTSSSPDYLKLKLFLIISRMFFTRKHPVAIDQDDVAFEMSSVRTGRIMVKASDIAFVAQSLNFLFTESGGRVYIESQFTRQFFPMLRNRWLKKLYGPDSALFNFTYEEFIRAEVLYSQLNNGDKDVLHRFLAVIYRPADADAKPSHPDYQGDIRIPFNDHLLTRYARHTARLTNWQKVYILLYYDGCRAFIISRFPDAFAGGAMFRDGESAYGWLFGFGATYRELLPDIDLAVALRDRKSVV
jgi:hypothetical protein